MRIWISFLCGAILALTFLPNVHATQLPPAQRVQIQPRIQFQAIIPNVPANTADIPQEEDIDEPVDENVVDSPEEIGDQFAQLHLQDGSIIGGDITTESIDVKTAYGVLNIPISRIVQIYPGLNSRPEFIEKITQLVEELGGPNAANRDRAQKELIMMGIRIRTVLEKLANENNAEQKKRITIIQATFEEELEANEEELLESDRPIIFGDAVVTPDFTIVGEIQQKQFHVKSKFGDLHVNLGDIRLADRKISVTRANIRKSVAVPAMAFFQTKPQSTGIRVNKGDRISVRADGVVQWTNWNSSSTPEGLTNRSNWNGINSGKLAARIGSNNSQCVQIGNRGDFVADSSGILYLGIAMRDNYATSGSYTWTGEYKAKIVVKPRAE